MKNTYVKCADWSWEDKLLYIKACIGDAIPHNKICGYVCHGKDELLDMYKRVGVVIHCYDDGMISFNVAGAVFNAFDSVEVKLSDLKQEKPKPTKFVKVEESIFDLKEEFERGELYYYQVGEYSKITDTCQLGVHIKHNSAYRKVEIDWRDEVENYRCVINSPYFTMRNNPDKFISMCHAIAELTDKPE